MKPKTFGFTCFLWPPTSFHAHAAPPDASIVGPTGEGDCEDENEAREVPESQRGRQRIKAPDMFEVGGERKSVRAAGTDSKSPDKGGTGSDGIDDTSVGVLSHLIGGDKNVVSWQ